MTTLPSNNFRYLAGPQHRRSQRVIYSLRALGKSNLPAQFALGGQTYRLLREVKHDFWAATGFYVADDGSCAVLKCGRTEEFAGLPLKWAGRLLCRREAKFYQRLAGLRGVPELLGFVGETGFVHRYVPGRPLSKQLPTPDGYFARLEELVRQVHDRGVAYVDANKPQNFLVGDDGLPYLIDFQISWGLFGRGERGWFNRVLLRHLQREDRYHLLKHKRRLRPDELTDAERRWARTAAPIRLHRFLTKPYFKFRRRTFKRLRETGQLAPEGSK